MQSLQRPRLVLLGLDGLPLSLVRQLAGEGRLPNLASLVDSSLSVRSELPEISPVNWTSLYTALGPGEHGVFGFTRFDPAEYTLSCVDFNAVSVPTIFDCLGKKGLTSRVINLPNTYPARPINGVLISGFTALDFEHSVYPPFLKGTLKGAGYRLEADTVRGMQDHDFLLADLNDTLSGRQKALEILWPDLYWDLFLLVITETDRLGHFLFPALTDPDHPLSPACRHFLDRVDAIVGDVLERFSNLPDPKRLIITADHGFTELRTEVDLNVWLQQSGYLHLHETGGNEWDASGISPGSTAFALDPGRIYLHTVDRFARGMLSPKRASQIREQIRDALLQLKYQGEPVLQEVFRAEDLYQGEYLPFAPDLICLAHPGFDLKAKFNRDEVFGLYGRRGCHDAYDAFYYDSRSASVDRLRDVGGEILRFFNTRPEDSLFA
ncbi:MAG: alkaline phosphatase family protein [Desulfovibrionales bacterium]